MDWKPVACVCAGLALLALVAFGGFFDRAPDMTPPHYADRCVESETSIVLLPVYNAALKSMQLMPMPQSRCTRYAKVCVAGRDFEGPIECPPLLGFRTQ